MALFKYGFTPRHPYIMYQANDRILIKKLIFISIQNQFSKYLRKKQIYGTAY
jgi:hypothetical protein